MRVLFPFFRFSRMKGKATPPKFERFLPDHGLVQQYVVQDTPERVLGVVVLGCVLDRLTYGYA
jgi:hypothetical protein